MGLKIKSTIISNNQFIFSNSFSVTQSKYRAGHRRNNDLTGIPAFKNVVDFEYKFSKYLTLRVVYIINHLKE